MHRERDHALWLAPPFFNDQTIFMPPFGQAYSDAELAAVANYVIAQFGGKAGRVAPQDVAKQRQE